MIASVCASKDGSASPEDVKTGEENVDAVGVASSVKLFAKARGVVGSGVRGRCTPSESTARRPEEKKEE